MINGFSTLGSVALHIARDWRNPRQRRSTRYTLEQAIEKVCFRRESIVAEGGQISYIWWSFGVHEGEIDIDIDRGKLAEVPIIGSANWARRWVPAKEIGGDVLANLDWNLGWDIVILKMGLTLGQRVLSRCVHHTGTDYWGEDCSGDESDIIYAEPGGGFIPVMANLMKPNPSKGFAFT